MSAIATTGPESRAAETPVKGSPRDVVMYLLVILMLYATVSETMVALFSYVDLLFPDRLEVGSIAARVSSDSIRFAVATLVVVFPVYLWGSHFLERELAANPQLATARVRKWLLSLTLFLAGLMMIGDVVCLVYSFLGGELTARFILKALVILTVSGAVFSYYLQDLRLPGAASPFTRNLSIAAIATVSAIVVAGFVVSGSPMRSRLAHMDAQRTADLRLLQARVVEYWQAKNKLPDSLDQLSDNIAGFVAPRDPANGQPYRYRVTGVLQFQLCANFNLPAVANDSIEPSIVGTSAVSNSWGHSQGPVCFTRTIDPAFYAPRAPATSIRKP